MFKASHHGTVFFAESLRLITNSKHTVAISAGALLVIDRDGNADRHLIPYGARLNVIDGMPVKPGEVLAFRDPLAVPIVAEQEGIVTLIDCVEGISVASQIDEATGMVNLVVIEQRRRLAKGERALKPRIVLHTEGKFHLCTPVLEAGTVIYDYNVENEVERGTFIAHTPIKA